jgi:hypothetical protein
LAAPAAAAVCKYPLFRDGYRGVTTSLHVAFPASSSLYLSWLAEDYVQLDDIEHAADIAVRMAALAVRTN